MANGRFISYLRVSTGRQEKSGLGLDAQRTAIDSYLNGGNWEVIKEFVEAESGRQFERAELKKALDMCRQTGATLLIAKLDRLARNVSFISRLMDSGVEFVVVDFPEANRFVLHLLAAVAEHESRLISERTKAALQEAKRRGKRLGSPANLDESAREKGRTEGNKAKKKKADEFALSVYPHIAEARRKGDSFQQIGIELYNKRILTPRGNVAWSSASVRNVFLRGQKILGEG